MKFADEAKGTISQISMTNHPRIARGMIVIGFERRAVGCRELCSFAWQSVIGAIEGVRKENFVFLNRDRRFERLGQRVRISARCPRGVRKCLIFYADALRPAFLKCRLFCVALPTSPPALALALRFGLACCLKPD